MLRLHYAPDNASLIVRIVLEELGLPFETALVDRRTRAQKSAAYRAMNPRGLIPVLETDDGPIFETAAILLWLCDGAATSAPAGAATSAPAGATASAPTGVHLAPAPGAPGRGGFLSWLLAMSNGLQTDLRSLTHPEDHGGEDPAIRAAVAGAAHRRIRDTLDQLEALAGAGHPWFAAEAVSALDIYASVMLRWFALYPAGGTGWFDLAGWPRLAALAGRIEARPAFRRAATAEGLGSTPLSAPQPPIPPEGSAI